MAKKKDSLIKQIQAFVDRFYARDADLVEKTGKYLKTADYAHLVRLMEKVEQDFQRNAGVQHYEVLGYAYQLAGEHYLEIDFALTEENYQKALATFQKGMDYATGSGEGWQFRTLYDSVHRRLKTLQTKQQKKG